MALFSKFKIGNYSVGGDNSTVIATDSCNIVDYHMLTRCSDDGFHPTTAPKTEYIEIVVKCNTIPMHLYNWYEDNSSINACIDVSIQNGENPRQRMIIIEGAQCFSIVEEYSDTKLLRKVTLRMAVSKISVENCVFSRTSISNNKS